MAVYLLSWDPTRWDWRNIKEQAEQVARGVPVVRQWSCGSNRRIFNGDIVYFIRQGREPRGIFGRGEVVRGSYEATNVDVQDAQRGRATLVIDVRFSVLENAVEKVVLPHSLLKGGVFGKFVWDVRESGVKIPEPVAVALEQAWRDRTAGGKGAKAATSAAPEAEAEPVAPPVVSPPGIPSADSVPAAIPAPENGEQERLKQEREARLRTIRERELKRRKTTISTSEAAAPVPLDATRRNEILVQNYFIMLDAELQGELYSKADHRNRIMKELGDTDPGPTDLAHRHISAILAETGLPFADGFPPKAGFDPALEEAVHLFIEANPELVEALWIGELPAPAAIPVELDDARAHWTATPEASGFRPSNRPAWHPAGLNEIDYRVREAGNRELALAGERFVLAFERARLREAGMKDSTDKVSWQSQTFGDSFGYDIRSLEEDGSERFICVKTTNFGARFPFTLTHRELERAHQQKTRFYVYRLFQFSRNAKLFILPAERLIQETLQPVAFRSWV